MRMTLTEMILYTRNAPTYYDAIIFVQSGVTRRDEARILMYLRRLCTADKDLSFYLVLSTHSCIQFTPKITIRTGKKGRPKKKVIGKPTNPHIHGFVVGQTRPVPTKKIANYLRKSRPASPESTLTQAKIKQYSGDLSFFLRYMKRQADYEHTGGNFRFSYFLSPYYRPELTAP